MTATFFALFAALPFAWMILTVFKTNTDLYNPNQNPFLYNEPPTLENITYLFEKRSTPRSCATRLSSRCWW